MIGNYTPANNAEINDRDDDLGSTSPALLGGDFLAQGGKDGHIRVINIQAMAGTSAHMGGEAQTVANPGGGQLLPAMAVLKHGAETWLFVANYAGTEAWSFRDGELSPMWKNRDSGNSPVAAGGLLYVYSPGGQLRVYDAEKGLQLASFDAGRGHWNSAIAVDGHVAVPEGNANRSRGPGVLDIWSLPAK
jgi:hypothetical protein